MAERPILLVGGGTGGHITPLVAIGEELKRKGLPFVFVGSKNGPEKAIVQNLGWTFCGVSTGKWRRESGLIAYGRNIVDLLRVIAAFFQSIAIIHRTKVRLIFSKGGHVALPVVWAAWLLRCRVIIHESDAVMGLANRWSLPVAKKVLTSFAPAVFSNVDTRFVQVGLPIRANLRQAAHLSVPQKTRPIILILPGSQGATSINKCLKPILKNLLAVADVVHMTGEKDYVEFGTFRSQLTPTQQKQYRPSPFIDRELPLCYRTADIVVVRSSATIAAEVALFSKALYMVPLPWAAGNHQLVNAQILAKASAVVVCPQENLTPEKLLADLRDLLEDSAMRQQLGERLHQYFNETQTLEKIISYTVGV